MNTYQRYELIEEDDWRFVMSKGHSTSVEENADGGRTVRLRCSAWNKSAMADEVPLSGNCPVCDHWIEEGKLLVHIARLERRVRDLGAQLAGFAAQQLVADMVQEGYQVLETRDGQEKFSVKLNGRWRSRKEWWDRCSRCRRKGMFFYRDGDLCITAVCLGCGEDWRLWLGRAPIPTKNNGVYGGFDATKPAT